MVKIMNGITLKGIRGQSAMEYLMTYGWAILIIAIVMAAFFMMGLFKSPVGTTCRSPSGFICKSPIYNSGTGAYSVIIGQGSGSSWTTTTFTMDGTGIATALTANTNTGNVLNIPLASGQLVTINFTIPTTDSSPGNIYAHYTEGSVTAVTKIAIATWG